MMEIDEEYYLKICSLVPGLHMFLIKNNILKQYKIGISIWIHRHPHDYSEIIKILERSPNHALTAPFGWITCNTYLQQIGFNKINWNRYHDIFERNYKDICLKQVFIYKKIKIV